MDPSELDIQKLARAAVPGDREAPTVIGHTSCVLAQCPGMGIMSNDRTGWFIPTAEGPDYLNDVMAPVHRLGELEAGGILMDADPNEALSGRAESTS